MKKAALNIALVSTLLIALALPGAAATARPDITKKVLDNGLTVLVKPEPGSGLVSIVAMVKVGASQETIGNAGIGNFVAQLILASTRTRSAEDVAMVADQVGGNLSSQWHPDFTEVRAITTSTRFDTAMRLIGECLTEANFEEKWVEQIRGQLFKQLRAESDDIFNNAYAELRGLLYEDSGYKRPSIGFERTILRATPEDLQKFYSTYYVPNNIVISIVGDVTPDRAIKLADGAFAGVLPGKLPINRGTPDETMDQGRFRAMEADIPAAYLLLGWLAPGVTSEDYAATRVAANALGGGKGSVMFQELRQKQGMGYDLGTMYPKFRYQSHVVAYVVTDPFKLSFPSLQPTAVLEDVKSALISEIDKLKSTALSEKDLQRAKGYTIGSHALGHQHLIDRAFELCWFETIGAGFEAYKTFPDMVDKVTAEDVQRVAKKYLNNYAAIVLVPKPKQP